QIDNVNAVSFSENVFLHFRVPTANLMAEMHAGLQQLFHRNSNQTTFSFMSIGLCTRRDRGFRVESNQSKSRQWISEISDLKSEIQIYRFENWNRLRAPFCPYFLRSLIRGSRVTRPACFKAGRRS